MKKRHGTRYIFPEWSRSVWSAERMEPGASVAGQLAGLMRGLLSFTSQDDRHLQGVHEMQREDAGRLQRYPK